MKRCKNLKLHSGESVQRGIMTPTEQKKNLTKRERVSSIIIGIIALIASILTPYLTLLWQNVNFSANIDASFINGILTGTAIVFGFVTYELREVKASLSFKTVFSLPLLFFLYTTVIVYSFSAMFDNVTNMTLFVASSNFVFNIIYYVFVSWFRDTFTTKRNNWNKS